MSPMPQIPSGGGSRQERAAQIKAEMEAKQTQGEAVAAESTGPQPGQEYTLREGDTLESIARQVDQEPDAIWSHDNNEELRDRRGSPGELQAGDTLFIPAEEKGTGPVGQGDYVVKQGDCISSIAKDTGHFWETIWNHADNAELKEVRKDPNVLLPGDRVTIPEVTPKEESGETEQRHRFVRRGEPAVFRLQLLRAPRRIRRAEDEPREPKPRANVPYNIFFDGELVASDVTDAEGRLACPIPGNTREGKLVLEPGTEREKTYPIRLGHVPPITELRGVKARLANLGLPCGDETDELTNRLRAALRAFQERHGLTVNGEPDQATRDKLVEVHGS